MNWAMLIELILNNGVPLALKLAEKWDKRDQPVTADEIAELKALASNTPVTQMTDALTRAGISPDSPEGKKLLSLVGAYKDPTVDVPAGSPAASTPVAEAEIPPGAT